MIYTAPCVMFLMLAGAIRGQVGGGWALKVESFLGPLKWHRADRPNPLPLAQVMDLPASKIITHRDV